mgnify:CR=1 FL=1
MAATKGPMQTQWKKLQLIAIAGGLSFLGSSVTTFAVMFREKEASQSAVLLAGLALAMAVPNILMAPIAGLLADKYSSTAASIPALLVMAVSSLSIALIEETWWAFVALFVTACAGTVVGASFQAAQASVTAPEDMPRIQGMSNTYVSLGILFGPGLGGLLVDQTGYFWPFVLDAATFILLALAFVASGVNRPGVVHEAGEKPKAMAGLKFVFGDQLIRALVILVAVLIVALGMINVGEIFLVVDVLGASKLIYGFVGMAFAAGMILGGLLTAAIKVPESRQPALTVAGIAGLVISVTAIGLAPNWQVVLVISFVSGACNAALNAYAMGIILRRSDEDKRGRIMAAIGGVITTGSVTSTALAGFLIENLDVRLVIVGGGIVAGVILLIFGPAVIRAGRVAEPVEA